MGESKIHSNIAALFQAVNTLRLGYTSYLPALSVAAAWPLLLKQFSFWSRPTCRCSGFTRLSTFQEVKNRFTEADSLTVALKAAEEKETWWEEEGERESIRCWPTEGSHGFVRLAALSLISKWQRRVMMGNASLWLPSVIFLLPAFTLCTNVLSGRYSDVCVIE